MADVLKNDAMKKGGSVPQRFKEWFINDRQHTDTWRKEAREDFEFVAGRQFSDDEIAALKKQKRPIVVFNRTAPVIDSVHGQEIGNRREVRYIPREMGDAIPNELYTGAGEWFRDQANAETHESDSFRDMLICGMGWTETRLDFEEQADGKPLVERIDPFEMYWDFNSTGINLRDSRRRWRARRVPLSEAQASFPNYSRQDIDADWAYIDDLDNLNTGNEGTGEDDAAADVMVTIVQCQWIERETYYVVADPVTQQQTEMKADEFSTLTARMKTLGMPLDGTPMKRKKIMQAFFGKVILAVGDAPCQTEFSLQCITGKRDRNTGTFYGLVRSMKDPQRWANKWLSQMMHIMNSNSKGGLLAEKGAFENERKAEETWADPSSITWLNDGAIAANRVKEKPPAQFPAGFQYLTEYALSSIRDASGVSVEMLGLRNADQAASLEAQRKQAGMTILQPFFDALKFYRERQGLVMLYYIQHDLSDGRLIKIIGEQGAQYVPLMRQATSEYDIIVDDAPTSPNQKEAAWSIMMQLLPTFAQFIPPDMIVTLLEYSPLPSTIVEKLKKQAQQQQESQAQQAEEQKQTIAQREGAEVEKIQSETQKNQVTAQVQAQEAAIQLPLAQMEQQSMVMKHQTDQTKLQVDMFKAITDREQTRARQFQPSQRMG